MAGEATPLPEAQVQSTPLSDLPAAQPYGASPPSSEPVVTHPEPHQPSPPPELAPVFDSRRNRWIDPLNNRMVKAPGSETPAVADEPPTPAEPVAPVAIQHTPLTLNLARQYGIPEHIIAATPTADLRAEIALLQQQPTQRAAAPAPPAEEPVDWGINPETKKPYTEADFAEYPLHQQMVKSQHEMKKQLATTNRELADIKRKNAEQAGQTVLSQFHSLCDQHPEIFGAKDAAAGSPEAISREMMQSQLSALVNSKRHTNLEQDFRRMLVAFRPQAQPDPLPQNTGRITAEQWNKSGLAQTGHRNTAPLPKTRRQQITERVDDEARRNGIKLPAGGPTGDLSDLPPR